jgi:site-specific recombinase XerC
MNRVIFRLACCCGLRVSEISALRLTAVYVGAGRPHLWISPEGAKGKKARVVPIWWDAGTLDGITAWKREREQEGARPIEAFVCCLRPDRSGKRLIRHTIRERFRSA